MQQDSSVCITQSPVYFQEVATELCAAMFSQWGWWPGRGGKTAHTMWSPSQCLWPETQGSTSPGFILWSWCSGGPTIDQWCTLNFFSLLRIPGLNVHVSLIYACFLYKRNIQYPRPMWAAMEVAKGELLFIMPVYTTTSLLPPSFWQLEPASAHGTLEV